MTDLLTISGEILTNPELQHISPGLRHLAIPIDDIAPDSSNAMGHTEANLNEIARSYLKFGQRKPLVGNRRTGETEAGAGQWLAAKKLGWKWIAVSWEDEDPRAAAEFGAADNATASADWNMERLQEVWEQSGGDVPGLDEGRLRELWKASGQEANGKEPKDVAPQLDKAAELQEKWGTRLGQIWQLGEHRLAVGDCTDKAVVEAVMRGEGADMGLTSPPYAVGKEYEKGVSFDEHLALLRGVADRALEVIKVGGFFFTNFGEIAPQSHTKPLTGSDRQCLYPISKDYWQIFHVERGMDLYAQRVWYKPFNRLQKPFWSYKTSIPHYQEWEHIWTWRLPGGDGDSVYDWDISVRAVWDTRNESTEDKPLTRHVAAFPVCLPERAIKAHSGKGDIVWEPFNGSGTTLIACENLGRKCRGIEIEPKYCAVTLDRWVTLTGREPVLLSE